MTPWIILSENPALTVTGVLYAGAAASYGIAWRSTKAFVGRMGTAFMIAAGVGNLALIIQRWIEAGRFPAKSLYESLVFLGFFVAVVYLFMERNYRTRVFGALAALGAVGILGFAVGKWDAEIVNLPPALQSGWFMPHVLVYFAGYAAVFFATVAAVVQLIKPNLDLRAGSMLTERIDLEKVIYDSIKFGFTMLTVGLLIGSVWAKSAWGDYWVWDPKENWSLVTWLVYGAYLHLRKVKGWRGRKASWIAIAGFAVVMFTYLGMEMLPTAEESAHVYTQQ